MRSPRARIHELRGGFTLIEVLVVMVLMALLTAAAMTTLNYAFRHDGAETEARRIAALSRLAAEEALLTGREYGLRIDDDQLRFFIFEDEAGQWQALDEDNTFRRRPLPEDLEFDLVLEGQAVMLGRQPENEKESGREDDAVAPPQLMFFSSGQITPFTLTVSEPDGETWTVEGDLLGRLDVKRAER